MKLTITDAENGFVVAVEESEENFFYFVALDIDDVCSIVQNILVNPNDALDMSHLAFETVPRDE